MVAPLTPADHALLDADPQLIRRLIERQYRMVLVRTEPGGPAERSFETVTGHPVGWHRRKRLAEMFARGLVYADDDLTVAMNRRSLFRDPSR